MHGFGWKSHMVKKRHRGDSRNFSLFILSESSKFFLLLKNTFMLVPHSIINNRFFFIYFNGSLSFLFFGYNFFFGYLYICKFVPRLEVMISLISCTAIWGWESGCQGLMCLLIGVQWEICSDCLWTFCTWADTFNSRTGVKYNDWQKFIFMILPIL